VLRDLSLLPHRARLQALHEQRIDVAFLSSPPNERGISREQGFECPLAVILPISHPLANQETVPLEALADEDWIWGHGSKNSRICQQILHLCQQAGFEPRIVQTVNQFHAGVSLVAAGVGIMVIEAWTRAQQLMRDSVVYRPLKDITWGVGLQMLWRANESIPLLEEFLAVAREVSADISTASSIFSSL
jgi:DNA-binding transcriptional LysR family regulator